MSITRSTTPENNGYTPVDFIRAELGDLYKDRVHLEFAEVLLCYQDKQDIAVHTPRGFLYCYKGELGFSMCLEQEGVAKPLSFTELEAPSSMGGRGYLANSRSYLNFEPTIILRRYYRGNTDKQ